MGEAAYRNRIRIRACGVLQREGSVLLVQLHSPVRGEQVWMPPGGGVEFGESVEECLRREFREETGLEVEVGPFLFFNEMIEPPFHAVELYFKVKETGGSLRVGSDPEHIGEDWGQLIKDIRFVPVGSIGDLQYVPSKLPGYLS